MQFMREQVTGLSNIKNALLLETGHFKTIKKIYF
jgi:hypothetical protein